MTTPLLLPGNRFRAYRSTGGTPEIFQFICIAQSITLTITNEFEDATVADCDAPLSVPWRKSTLRSRSWGGRVAGAMDASRFDKFREDAASEDAVRYQFLMDRAANIGGGTWTGGIRIENLEITKQNNGITNWTAQFRGEDAVVWSAVA